MQLFQNRLVNMAILTRGSSCLHLGCSVVLLSLTSQTLIAISVQNIVDQTVQRIIDRPPCSGHPPWGWPFPLCSRTPFIPFPPYGVKRRITPRFLRRHARRPSPGQGRVFPERPSLFQVLFESLLPLVFVLMKLRGRKVGLSDRNEVKYLESPDTKEDLLKDLVLTGSSFPVLRRLHCFSLLNGRKKKIPG